MISAHGSAVCGLSNLHLTSSDRSSCFVSSIVRLVVATHCDRPLLIPLTVCNTQGGFSRADCLLLFL